MPNRRLQTSLQTNPEKGPNQAEKQGSELPFDLAAVVKAWPTLPEHIRAAIRALVGLKARKPPAGS